MWMSESAESGGKVKWGVVKVCPPDYAVLITGEQEQFFVLQVAKNVWDQMEPRQREALVDERLCRCHYDDVKQKLSIRKPPVEAFPENVKRYGAWRAEIEELLEASKQMPLPNVPPPTKRRVRTARKGRSAHL